MAKDDPTDVGRQLIAAAKRFAQGRRKVIGATVQGALAGQLGDFPVKEVSAEIEALTPRKKRAARKAAAGSKSRRATKESKPRRQGPQALAGQAAARERAQPPADRGEGKQARRRADKQASREALIGVAAIAEIQAVGTK